MRIFIHFEDKPLFFEDPVHMVRCDDPAHLPRAFEEMERLNHDGFYLAGFLSYEAGYAFEKIPGVRPPDDFPLVMMGAYRRSVPRMMEPSSSKAEIRGLRLNISREKYGAHIDAIRRHIALGDVYQITYCLKMCFEFKGDARSLYAQLFRAQPIPYPAYIEGDGVRILSLSPERFIKKNGSRLVTEPMKGTWPRGRDPFTDLWARACFARDRKNRAENVMIADLLRNDLGRIGRKVRAPKLFTITPYKTLFQMTSTVTSQVEKGLSFYDLFRAIFPSGSVTGAPKVKAMEIIRQLEGEPRRIYTGAIGYITPDRDMYFNVPIRTILLRGQRAEMGIGGGIVWDSTAQGEWEEGLLKARFLTDLSTAPFLP